MRDRITFKCSVCGEENYIGTRNKKKHPERMTVKKYCAFFSGNVDLIFLPLLTITSLELTSVA